MPFVLAVAFAKFLLNNLAFLLVVAGVAWLVRRRRRRERLAADMPSIGMRLPNEASIETRGFRSRRSQNSVVG